MAVCIGMSLLWDEKTHVIFFSCYEINSRNYKNTYCLSLLICYDLILYKNLFYLLLSKLEKTTQMCVLVGVFTGIL